MKLSKMILKNILLGIIMLSFIRLYAQNENRFFIKTDNKWGFINSNGEILIQPKFEKAGYFNNGLAPVKIDGKWGYVDVSGNQIISPQFDEAQEFNEGLTRVVAGDSVCYIDTTGKIIYSVLKEVADLFYFYNGYGKVKKNGRYNFVDRNGVLVFDEWFDDVKDFESNVVGVKKGICWGAKSNTGEWVIMPIYQQIGEFLNSIWVFENSECFYLNRQGEKIFNKTFARCETFEEGVAVIGKMNGDSFKYGVIDSLGKIMIPIEYDYISSFKSGRAVFCEGGKCGIIDKTGNIIIDAEYQNISIPYNGISVIVENMNQYLINESNRKILGPYKKITMTNTIEDGLVLVFKEGSWNDLYYKNANVHFGYYDIKKNKLIWSNW